jgi:hypothetical protein
MRADALFRARVADLGGEVLEPEWLGTRKPHRVRCGAGHEHATYPTNVLAGKGICRTCAHQGRSQEAEAAFRERVAELGGIVLEEGWLGNHEASGLAISVAPRPHLAQAVVLIRTTRQDPSGSRSASSASSRPKPAEGCSARRSRINCPPSSGS